MNVKQENRKKAIDALREYVLTKLKADEDGWLRADKLLNVYGYESGISMRTLEEYLLVLAGAGFVKYSGRGVRNRVMLPGVDW